MGLDYAEVMKKFGGREKYIESIRCTGGPSMVAGLIHDAIAKHPDILSGLLMHDRKFMDLLLEAADTHSFERAYQCRQPELASLPNINSYLIPRNLTDLNSLLDSPQPASTSTEVPSHASEHSFLWL